MFIKKILFFVLLYITSQSYAQHYFGVATSNYGGIQSLSLNPANVAGGHLWFDCNIASFNATFANNVFTSNGSILSFFDASKRNNISDLVSNFDANAFDQAGGGVYFDLKNAVISKSDYSVSNPELFGSASFTGPSIMFDVMNKFGVAITTKYVSTYNLIDQMESSDAFKGIDNYLNKSYLTPDEISHEYNLGNFKSSQSQYAELGLTIGGNLYKQNSHLIKGGFTLKRYVGLEASVLKTLRTSFQIKNVRYVPTVALKGNVSYVKYYNTYLPYSSEESKMTDRINYLFNGVFGSDKNIPTGWGLDYGFVYEYRPHIKDYKIENNAHQYNKESMENNEDYSRSKYLFKVSASIMDMGYIDFNKNLEDLEAVQLGFSRPQEYPFSNASQMLINALNQLVPLFSLNEKNFISGSKFLDTSTNVKTLTFRPATSFIFGLDYKIKENIFVSFNWVQNLIVKYSNSTRTHTLLNITPRYESSKFDFALPITYNDFTKIFYWGFGFRFNVMHFGMDNATGLIGNFKGTNFYAGIKFSISKANVFKRFFSYHSQSGKQDYIKHTLIGSENKPNPYNSVPNNTIVQLSQEANVPILKSAQGYNNEKNFNKEFVTDIARSTNISSPHIINFQPSKERLSDAMKIKTDPTQFKQALTNQVNPNRNNKFWIGTTLKNMFSRNKRATDVTTFIDKFQPKKNKISAVHSPNKTNDATINISRNKVGVNFNNSKPSTANKAYGNSFFKSNNKSSGQNKDKKQSSSFLRNQGFKK